MPYTKKELKSNDFYQSFVDNLQINYLKELIRYAKNRFRRQGVLYSFEDITSGNGIETVNMNDIKSENFDALYRRHLGPNDILDENQLERAKSSTNLQYPEYTKRQLLENTIDRNISELSESFFADELPETIANGDVVTNEDASDYTRWLIESNQKRIFSNLGQYYGRDYDLVTLKTLPQSEIDAIPDGEPVE